MPKGGKKGGGAEASKLMKRRSASYEELQALDWSAVQNSTKVKYDPNRLIFGATEDGFMELEEIDMEEVNAMVGVTGGGGAHSTLRTAPRPPPRTTRSPPRSRGRRRRATPARKRPPRRSSSRRRHRSRRRSASFEELQAVDWNAVTKSTPVKYDPNRLIFGATEDGFMELEEIDMEEVNAMAIGGAARERRPAGRSRRLRLRRRRRRRRCGRRADVREGGANRKAQGALEGQGGSRQAAQG